MRSANLTIIFLIMIIFFEGPINDWMLASQSQWLRPLGVWLTLIIVVTLSQRWIAENDDD